MELPKFVRKASGLLVPSKKETVVGVQCAFCPDTIWKDREVNGRLHLYEGKPICPRCRVLKFSKSSKQIRSDEKKYKKDVEVREKFLQDKENRRVEDIAVASQKRNPKVKLKRP